MNRKQKIVVSIVGITIVLLALLGLTYAYYLTRIQGNTNTTSISITTADLKLEYSEGEDSNIDITGLMPGQDIKTKTFTVTNSGNNRVDNYVVAIIDVTNTLTRTEDLTYTLTCVQKNAEGVVTGTCRGVDTDPDTEYPTQNSMIVTNSIDAEYSHEYTLKLTYENLTDTDQSIDMGSTIKGKVQIYGLADTIDLTGDVTGINPGDYVQINSEQMTSQIVDGKYTLIGIEPGIHSLKIMNKDGVKQNEQYIKINKGQEASVTTGSITLEDESTVNGPIITMVDASREATININKTNNEYELNDEIKEYLSPSKQTLNNLGLTANTITPDFTLIANTDEGVFATEDDYGTSYYFRGNIDYNYVEFAGFIWRIVRINGDGSIRIILDGSLNLVKHKDESDYVYKNSVLYELDDDGLVAFKNTSGHDKSYVGYMYGDFEENSTSYEEGNANIKSSFIKIYLEKFYEEYLLQYQDNFIADTMFCGDKTRAKNSTNAGDGYGNDNKVTYYSTYERVSKDSTLITPTLECAKRELIADKELTDVQLSYSRYTSNIDKNTLTSKGVLLNNNLTYPIGLLSADELIFSGVNEKPNRTNQYIGDAYNYSVKTINNIWWTMSPKNSSVDSQEIYTINHTFNVLNRSTSLASASNAVRPVINLKANLLIDTGNGSQGSPYTFKAI